MSGASAVTPVAAVTPVGPPRRHSSRRANSTGSSSSSSSDKTPASAPTKSELNDLRKQVAIRYLRNVGGLNTLASDYNVTPQSCSYYVKR